MIKIANNTRLVTGLAPTIKEHKAAPFCCILQELGERGVVALDDLEYIGLDGSRVGSQEGTSEVFGDCGILSAEYYE